MSGAGERELGAIADRGSLDPKNLKDMGAGVVIAAFSSVQWLMKALNCTEQQARQFKANAQHDFDCLMMAARQARGRRP